jgi:putative DNA methylase
MKKKLIEVALPLDAINEASRREKSPFTKHHPRAMHVWWARRPLAACRAVLFGSLVDDPSSDPEQFPSEEAQEVERQRLFRIIEDLVKWENSNNETVLNAARKEILKSTNGQPPPVLDPFCGGGSIPLEAQRLGLEAHASDLNPVAVLITKALIEIPPKFACKPPVNSEARKKLDHSKTWKGAQGLAEDVRYYGQWMRDEAEKRIGHLYPKVKLPKEYGGVEATVIAWLWARTVKCPNPACGAQMPLVRSFWLSSKANRKAWVHPLVDKKHKTVRFEVKSDEDPPAEGTVSRRGATCVVCGSSAQLRYVRSEGMAGRLDSQLMAVVADGGRGRVYLSPDAAPTLSLSPPERKRVNEARSGFLSGATPERLTGGTCYGYGLTTWGSLFTPRQLVALTVFSDLVGEARERVLADARKAGLGDDNKHLNDNAFGATAYADAVTMYLGIAVSRFTDFCNSICSWDSGNTNMRQLFARQAIPMAWDYAETNPLRGVVTPEMAAGWVSSALEVLRGQSRGRARQLDSTAAVNGVPHPLICTDPPYYDNIGYADVSDFFYVWLRRSLAGMYPDLFSTLLTPKAQELVATSYRFGGNREEANRFFEEGLGKAFTRMREVGHPSYPMTAFYAFKQAESEESSEDEASQSSLRASTGWETMLAGLLKAGFAIGGTWPMRTEQQQRSVAARANALASSVVLACRPRPLDAPLATRREFINALKAELPAALRNLQRGNIAPVDLAQAAIGPGMAVFSRYSKVVEADGSAMTVRTALALINQILDEVLAEQEGEFDSDTRWAVAWFEQRQLQEGPFGEADVLARAKNTAVDGLVDAGILSARAGKVRLLGRSELNGDWDPTTTRRLTVWEVTHQLIRALEKEGEAGAAALLRKVGALGETAHDLAYRLYGICERKKWAQEGLAYNSLVIAWPEIVKLARSAPPRETQAQLRM